MLTTRDRQVDDRHPQPRRRPAYPIDGGAELGGSIVQQTHPGYVMAQCLAQHRVEVLGQGQLIEVADDHVVRRGAGDGQSRL